MANTDTGRVRWLTLTGIVLLAIVLISAAGGDPTPVTAVLALIGAVLLGVGLTQNR